MVPLEYNTLMRSCHLLPQIFKNVGHCCFMFFQNTWNSHPEICTKTGLAIQTAPNHRQCSNPSVIPWATALLKKGILFGIGSFPFFGGTGSIIVLLPNSSSTNKGFEHYLFDATLWSLPPPVNGHFRNRFIGGTYHIYLAYFLGLCFWRYTPNLYGQTYGTVVQYLQ